MESTADRRWTWALPLAIALGGGLALAATAPAPGPVPAAGEPIAGVLGWIAARLAGDDARATQRIAAALIGLGAALIAATLAGARPGWPGRLGGAVAAIWLLACPPARALAATLTPATAAIPALAGLALAYDRVARGGGARAGRAAGVAAVSAVLVDNRVWPAVLVTAALMLYRARRGARWGSGAAIAAALAALAWIGAAALAGGPLASAPATTGGELGRFVDELGPLAIALAGAGAITALGARGDRWTLVLLTAIALAALPLGWPPAPGALVVIAAGAGLAVAELVGRAPQPRHQIVAAASVLAVVIVSVVLL